MSEIIRLDKLLSDAGFGTRSEVKNLIKSKRVTVDGKIVRDSGTHINTRAMDIEVDGNHIRYSKYLYFLLNKPAGVVSATNDGLSETVIELLDGVPTKNLFPVGRLDKDTEGLLLITNDGQLAHELLSPRKHVDKTYIAQVDRPLSAADMTKFSKGLDIGDDKLTLPAEIRRVESDKALSEIMDEAGSVNNKTAVDKAPGSDKKEAVCYEVVIREGRYHQIKRMFEVLGSEVNYLKRMAMGPLKLDPELKPGEFRELTGDEVYALLNR